MTLLNPPVVQSRRKFIKQNVTLITTLTIPFHFSQFNSKHQMTDRRNFDVIIVGGSYAGLAAGMALGRALKHVLIIDGGNPCNKQTPHSHNFLTQDGKTPNEIVNVAKEQVKRYDTVEFLDDIAMTATKNAYGFQIQTNKEKTFVAKKLIFATGIKERMPDIPGFTECWGISVLHCPYCHGYEIRNEKTGILGNGEYGFEFSTLISNWTKDLILFTNGKSTLTAEQTSKLKTHEIEIVEEEIVRLEHEQGKIAAILFKAGTRSSIKALYTRNPFDQHCTIPIALGCEMTDEGYIKVDAFQKTSVHGISACGDNTTRMRSVSNAVAMGATAGMMANREIIFEEF